MTPFTHRLLLRYAVAIVVPLLLGLVWYQLGDPWSRLPVPILIVVLGALIIAAISRRGSERTREVRAVAYNLIDLAPDGILCATATGTILYANPALCVILRIPAGDDLVGKHVLEVVHPDSHPLVTRRMAETPVGHVAPWMEEKWIRGDGSTATVEVAAVSTRDQGRIGWLVLVRDLTGRLQAEADLRASEERFHALFQTAIDAILLFDNGGRYIDANASAVALLGYSREEIISRHVGDFTAEVEKAATVAQVFFDRGSGEGSIVRKDGETRYVEYRVDTNVVPGTHCLFIADITDRKILERTSQQLPAKLLESQDAERRRIARQLHETTAQTLAALRMNLVHMRSTPADLSPPLLDESIALTEQGIREVRTLSHLLYPPLIEDLGIVAALRWYVAGFSERSGIAVQLDAPDDLGRFPPAVENGILRIVQEALTNIHRHSGSCVARVALSRTDGEVSIVIEDEGKGMPEPGKIAPAGVGIASMRERAKEHGGGLQIASGGNGTRIEVRLRVTGDRA